jgi:hypothetical protein
VKPPVHQNAPTCPVPGCGGPLCTAASHARAGEIATSLICAACGTQHEGTAAEVAQAEKSEAAWERLQAREEAREKRESKVTRAGGMVAVKARRAPVKATQGRLFDGGGER